MRELKRDLTVVRESRKKRTLVTMPTNRRNKVTGRMYWVGIVLNDDGSYHCYSFARNYFENSIDKLREINDRK